MTPAAAQESLPGLHRGEHQDGEFARAPQAFSSHFTRQVLAFNDSGRGLVVAREKAARTGFTNIFGKLGKPLNGLTLPLDIEEGMRKRWMAQGHGSFLEFIREVIVVAEVGRSAVEDAQRRRLDAIEGKQQE